MSTAAASTTAADQTASPRRKPKASSSSPLEPILADLPLAAASEPKQKRYVARKKMVIQGKTYKPGDEIPFAHEILRIEGWIRAGYLNEVTQ